ncbi:NUDIX hydrolase (Modular protein) [Frankia sp. Hr75.2]|nr:NUDIX hydrolase (Modular protein) [Frankia sp. Hr75.2]
MFEPSGPPRLARLLWERDVELVGLPAIIGRRPRPSAVVRMARPPRWAPHRSEETVPAGDRGFVVRDTRIAYENPWMRVREDAIVRADGSPGLFGVVEKPDFALIIPVDASGVWLVEQFRHPVDGRYWEFPQGSWEDRPDVGPAELAEAELREETGLRAGRLDHLGQIFTAYGYADQACQVWLATELSPGQRELSVEEQDLVTRRFSHREWGDLLSGGVIKDASSLAAWALLCASPLRERAFGRAVRFPGS